MSENDQKAFECPICMQLYREPMRLECSHIFCKQCVVNRSVTTCPECRDPIQRDTMHRAIDIRKRMENRDAECPTCHNKMKVSELRTHEEHMHPDAGARSPAGTGARPKSVTRVHRLRPRPTGDAQGTPDSRARTLFDRMQAYDALHNHEDARETAIFAARRSAVGGLHLRRPGADQLLRRRHPSDEVVNGSQYVATDIFRTVARPHQRSASLSEPTNRRNWHTFTCAYCQRENMDRETLLEHCNTNHRDDADHQRVCPICASLPYGNPTQRSGHLLDHLNRRHKYDVDRFADFNCTDEESLANALMHSISNLA